MKIRQPSVPPCNLMTNVYNIMIKYLVMLLIILRFEHNSLGGNCCSVCKHMIVTVFSVVEADC